MSSGDDNTGILLLLGLYLLGKLEATVPDVVKDVVKSLEDTGARVYEKTHPDAAYSQDLPGKRLTKAQIVALAKNMGFADPNTAAAVALAESGGYPGIAGDNGRSIGLWQINMDYHPSYSKAQLTNPTKNAQAAVNVSRGGTYWEPWTTYRNGAYRRYL